MRFWPFTQKQAEPLEPEELRDRLIALASTGSHRKLRALCLQTKERVAANLDSLCRVPEGIAADQDRMNRYVQCLMAVAQCLANECDSPQLWNKLTGGSDDNPLVQWERWHSEVRHRMGRLEYDELIDEGTAFLESAKGRQGAAARRHEAMFNGRLGELWFHSGNAAKGEENFTEALRLCREIGDDEGERVYLSNLLEVYRYIGDRARAVESAKELVVLAGKTGQPAADFKSQLERIERGEPLCRVVCVLNGVERELDQITSVSDGRYEFQFRRNRIHLHRSVTLVNQANELASAGRYADALEKYHEAATADPHDPEATYQSGTVLLEMGLYDKARQAFEEVERLAPGWFRCRSDRWLARSLEAGDVTHEEFQILRCLEDGNFPPHKLMITAQRAVDKYPNFAPFHLILGNYYRDQDKTEEAVACYRKGLELVVEPDLESRLLAATAGMLPKDSPERAQFIDRVLSLEGSLVANAAARLMRA